MQTAQATETYICNISETIKAEFKKGKWVQTSVSSGEGIFRVTVEGSLAEIVEQGTPVHFVDQ